MHVAWEFVEFIEVMTLMISIYYLRNMHDHLSINNELRVVCFATLLMSFADYYKDNMLIYLIQAIRDLAILIVSNILPVLKSYNDRYEIWLTQDVIKSFDFSLTNLDTLMAFRQYLQTVPVEDEEAYSISASTTPSETKSADVYIWFFLAVVELEKKPSFAKAQKIKKTYFHVHPRLFPRALTCGIEDSLARKLETGSAAELADLYAGAKDYALEQLRLKYFPMYLLSARFRELQKDVVQFLRLKNREEICKERQGSR